MIAESLAGRRVAVTGATGFLGTALVERLLRCVPGCEVVALVRPGRRVGAAERVRRDVVRNEAFDGLRREWGSGFDDEVARRLTAVGGDVGQDGLALNDEDRATLASCDVVIHSAAAVSFDVALDTAVEVNLLGPRRVVEVLAGGRFVRPSGVRVHRLRGRQPPGRFPRGAPDRHPVLDGPGLAGRGGRRPAGPGRRRHREPPARAAQALLPQGRTPNWGRRARPLLATRAERLRQSWVDDRLVELGRARAQALGWPDAYAYTKALGERALVEGRGAVPVSIVRPSIIESSLVEPLPGWIRGFRMAEPVIISYGRGLLKDFPGLPEGVIDVIPVDLVVGAVLAVAAAPPPEEPAVVPGRHRDHQPSAIRRPRRPGPGVVLRAPPLRRRRPAHRGAGLVLPGTGPGPPPAEAGGGGLNAAERARGPPAGAGQEGRRGRPPGGAPHPGRTGPRLRGALRRLHRDRGPLRRSPPPGAVGRRWTGVDQETFCFDPAAIDWAHYVRDVHLPSVVHHARVRTRPSAKGHDQGGPGPAGRARPGADPGRLRPGEHAHRLQRGRVLRLAGQPAHGPGRADALRGPHAVRGAVAAGPRPPGPGRLPAPLLPPLRGRPHRPACGSTPGSCSPTCCWRRRSPRDCAGCASTAASGTAPCCSPGPSTSWSSRCGPLFDDVVCARLDEVDGRLTGHLASVPPTGEARAMLLAEFALAEHLDLGQAVAYADSASDLPMLESVGFPVAVNPEPKLATVARRRGWHVEHWKKAPGGPRPLLPMGERLKVRA